LKVVVHEQRGCDSWDNDSAVLAEELLSDDPSEVSVVLDEEIVRSGPRDGLTSQPSSDFRVRTRRLRTAGFFSDSDLADGAAGLLYFA
jgi:hypothetical protein